VTDAAKLETVRRLFDSFSQGQVDENVIGASFAPTVEVFDFPEAPGRHRYRGHDGVRQFLADVAENWKSTSIEVGEITEVGQKILVLGRQKSVGALAGVPVENDFGEVFRFEGDRIAEVRMFRDHEQAKEAAGA